MRGILWCLERRCRVGGRKRGPRSGMLSGNESFPGLFRVPRSWVMYLTYWAICAINLNCTSMDGDDDRSVGNCFSFLACPWCTAVHLLTFLLVPTFWEFLMVSLVGQHVCQQNLDGWWLKHWCHGCYSELMSNVNVWCLVKMAQEKGVLVKVKHVMGF